METHKIITEKGTFIFVEVNRHGVIFFESMGYLIYKEPDYENWVTDEELSNPKKLNKYLKRVEGKSDYKKICIKLPPGNYQFIAVIKSGLLDEHESSQNLTEKTAAQIVNGTPAMLEFSKLILKNSSLKKNQNYAILKLCK